MSAIQLDLSDENDIGFTLVMEGSDKEFASVKPNIRFVLTEQETGRGWVFAANKSGNDIAVSIPSMKGHVMEDRKYCGKLEVIMGGRYFTPTEVDVEFIEPLKVEATITTVSKKNHSKTDLLEESVSIEESSEPTFSIESEINSVIVKKKQQPAIPMKTISEEDNKQLVELGSKPVLRKKPQSYAELTKEQKTQVNSVFLDKCQELGINSKEVKKLMSEGTSYTKKRLTALLASSAKEVISKL